MKNLVICVMMGLFLSLSFAGAQEIYEENGHYRVELTENFDMKSGGKLVIDRAHGDVEIRTWNKDQVKIQEFVRLDVFTRQEAEEVMERIRSEYVVTSARIVIENQGWRGSVQRDFEITLPAEFDVDLYINKGDIRVDKLKGEITIESQQGDIIVNDTEGDIYLNSASGELEVNRAKGNVELNTAGGALEVTELDGELSANTAGGDIDIRGATKDVIVNTAGGEITLNNIGGKIDANTAGGDIDVLVCKSDVRVSTAGGDITMEAIDGELDARTHGGDIECEQVKGDINVQTHGGDIDLEEVHASVRAVSHAGEIQVEFVGKDFDDVSTIELRTSYGDIRLAVPAKMPATIQAEIRQHDRRYSSRNKIFSDFPLSTVGKGQDRGRIRMEGEINGGGTDVRLETTNGDIFLEKTR